MENDTPCRYRYVGLAPKALQLRASAVAAVRENHVGLAAAREQTHGDLTLAAKVRQAGVGQQV